MASHISITKKLSETQVPAKRLIDQGTLGLEASVSGLAERYGRGKTSHTIHVWWARRPHAAMRALVFASLCKQRNRSAEIILEGLALSTDNCDPVLEQARRLISKSYPEGARVLDMFGGGGTIPYESSFLGADTYSIDYNPLSVFIQKANLEFPQDALTEKSSEELTDLLKDSGLKILTELEKRTNDLYPLRKITSETGSQVFAYFWTYELTCEGCGYVFSLSKRPWLSRKQKRRTAIMLNPGDGRDRYSIGECPEGQELTKNWEGRNGTAVCPKCDQRHKNPSIKVSTDTPVALGALKKPRGKEFLSLSDKAVPGFSYLDKREKETLTKLDELMPSTTLPKWSGIVNAALYGIDTHADFLNKRQRVLLLELISVLRDEFGNLKKCQPDSVALYIIVNLSSLIDQLVDWNCRLSMWISQNEQVGRAFCGPGVPMLWDYVETDPLLKGPANLWSKLDRIVKGTQNFTKLKYRPTVKRAMSQDLPFESCKFDAIVTDPPYYDNIFYNVLADFFYTWKRLLFSKILPDLFTMAQSESEDELVSSKFRRGDSHAAHKWYCEQLTATLREAHRVLRDDGVLSFLYGHSSAQGWHAIVEGFRNSGLQLYAAEPLSIERRQRPRAMTSDAVNTCIVLVARKRNLNKKKLSANILLSYLDQQVAKYGETLATCGWKSEDIGMAIFARGVTQIANASEVSDKSDFEALLDIGRHLRVKYPEFKLQNRGSL